MANYVLGELLWKIGADTKGFDKSIDKTQAKTKKFQDTLKNVGGKLSTFVTLPILGAGVAALKTAGDFEKHRVALETMLGSADRAQKLLKQIEDFSASTPFQLPGLIQGSKRLLAFGVAADDVVSKMRNLGNAAQGDQATLDRLTLAYGKLRAKGRASLEELNMFTEAGVPILQALADKYGITTEKLFEYITAGKVGFEDVDEALTNLTTGQGKFAGLIEKQAETLNGRISTLQDNLGLLAKKFGEILLPAVSDIISGVTDAVRWFKGLDQGTKELILTIAGISAAIGPAALAVGKLSTAFNLIAAHPIAATIIALIGGFITLTGAIKSAIDEAKRLEKVQMSAFSATGLVEQITDGYAVSLDKAKMAQEALNTANIEAFKNLEKAKKHILSYRNSLDDATIAEKEHLREFRDNWRQTLKNLEIVEDYIDAKEKEADKVDKSTNAHDRETRALKDLIDNEKELQALRDGGAEDNREAYEKNRDKINDLKQKDYEKEKERIAELKKLEEERLDALLSVGGQIFNGLTNAANAYYDAELSMAEEGSKEQKDIMLERFEFNKNVNAINAAIAGATGAVEAYKALSGIPWVGPALGVAAAAALIGFAGAQVSFILSQKPPEFQDGGVIPGNQFRGDNVPVLANSGEMILNGGQQKELLDIARGGGTSRRGATVRILIDNGQDVIEKTINAINNGEYIIDARSVKQL